MNEFNCGEESQELDQFCGKWMNCLVVRPEFISEEVEQKRN